MHITVIHSETEWAAIADEWNQLLGKSITNVPFLRFEYLEAWWQHRGGGEWPESDLYIITARDDEGNLVGAAPLFLSKNHAGESVLLLLGSIEISDFLDILVQEINLEAFLDAILTHLTGPDAPQWDSLDWYNFSENSRTLPVLEKLASKYNLSFQQNRIQPAPYITLPNDFDDYLASLDKKYRRELTRKMRNAAGYFIPIQHYIVEDEDTLETEVNDFITMMREEEEKDTFLSDKMVAQIHAIAQAAFKAGWLQLAFLKVGKEKAAGYFNFKYDNRIWLYNSYLARKFGNLSPGIVLMGRLLQESIEKGYQEFDMMRGDEEYKYHLGGQDRFVVRVTLTRG
jgi:CelD/BcsL family acetyltransferase involved in cellulose biosynthesis